VTESALYLGVNPFETRVALRENGRLVTYRVERHRSSSRVGNLYKGRVTRLLPGMQAAFIDIGEGRDGFLYVREAGAVADDYTELFLDGDEDITPPSPPPAIDDLLREGQEILVQVVKDGLGSKGARLTSHISLPGRFLVYLPTVQQRGVSRRITEDEERDRLRSIVEAFDDPGGWIVRTAGEGQGASELEADRRNLVAAWQKIREASERTRAPALLHRELSPLLRAVRDLLTDAVRECWVDDVEAYREIVEFLDQRDPSLVARVKLYRRSADLMTAFGIEAELEKALRPRVWLKSGGYLVVNQTEALVAIDVNSGRTSKDKDFEESIFLANMEAARELARQLRLRDLGGLIVVDFIDMRSKKHIREVEKAVKEAMRKDKAKHDISRISRFGLMQISRQKMGAPIEKGSYHVCEHCQGRGVVRSVETLSLYYLRRIQTGISRKKTRRVRCALPLAVAQYLLNKKRSELAELERRHDAVVEIEVHPEMKPQEHRIEFLGE